MKSLADFSRIAVINLAHRTDRRAEIEEQLALVGLNFNSTNMRLFKAIRPDNAGGFDSVGARGCFMSHLSVLQEARGLDNLLILEDDLDFVPNVRELAQKALAELPADWGIFYGSCLTEVSPSNTSLTKIPPSASLQCAHFVAFNGAIIDSLVQYLEAILRRPTGHADGGPMHVDGAYSRFRFDRPEMAVFAAIPELGYQRSSRTDIHALSWFDRLPGIRNIVQMVRKWRARAKREKRRVD